MKQRRKRRRGEKRKKMCDDCYCQYSPNKRMTSCWFKNRFMWPDTFGAAITNIPRKTKNLCKFFMLLVPGCLVLRFFRLICCAVVFQQKFTFFVYIFFCSFNFIKSENRLWNLIRCLSALWSQSWPPIFIFLFFSALYPRFKRQRVCA